MALDLDGFGRMLDQTGLRLTQAQKSGLFEAYPMVLAMIARASPALPREAEPAVVFVPEGE
jgi:hypothetical protein